MTTLVRNESSKMMGETNLKACVLTSIFLLGMACATAAGRTIYVDDDGPADFNNIQAGINDANHGDTIIVSDGTYTGYGNRDIDFLGKAITLRGENGPENCIIDCNGTESEPHRGFYFHHGEDSNSVLDGLTITNGYGPKKNSDLLPQGGAIYCIGSSPTISNCTFTGNWAEFGGGIGCHQSSVCILNSTFTGNFANDWGGGLCFWEGNPIVTHCIIANNTSGREGGGIFYGGNQNPTISYCTISGNSSGEWGGGGIMLTFGIRTTAARISNCTISRNTANYSGGGIRLDGPYTHSTLPNVTITNCIITENSDNWSGGGIAFWCGSYVVENCTISANTTSQSRFGSSIYCDDSNVRITNSILWSPVYGYEIVLVSMLLGIPTESVLEISCSDVDGGQTEIYVDPYDCTLNWGPGNIDSDPCFSDPCNGDYHLKSQAGRYDPNSQSWVQDAVTSPCIDTGNPHSPIGLEPFPNGGVINMGAYGGTDKASKSYFGGPVCEIIVAGDVNGDCIVNYLDFRIMALNWLRDEN